MLVKQDLLADLLPLKLEEAYLTQTARIEESAEPLGLYPAAEWQKLSPIAPEPTASEEP